MPGGRPGTLEEERMATGDPYTAEEQALRRRLREFNTRTRNRVATLTGREEFTKSDDPREVLLELLENWTDLERLLLKHGAFYPLIDKVRRIRNDVFNRAGTFTRSDRAFQDAMRSIGMLEKGIRSAGAEEMRRRKREAEATLTGQVNPEVPGRC